MVGFVAGADVEGGAVGVGIYAHRLDAHVGAGASDAHGNLSTIGYQYLAEHQPAHPGLRFSRNAFKPSCPSGLILRAAMVSAVCCMASSCVMLGTRAINSFARAMA